MTSPLVSTYSAGAPTLVFQNAAAPIPCTLVPRNVTLSLAKAVWIALAWSRRSGINTRSTASPAPSRGVGALRDALPVEVARVAVRRVGRGINADQRLRLGEGEYLARRHACERPRP